MLESKFQTKVKAHIKKILPYALVFKLSDRYISGMPDLMVLSDGKVAFMELKAPGGKASKIQEVIIGRMKQQHIAASVCYNIEDVNYCLYKADMI